jgi:hypothetical protein
MYCKTCRSLVLKQEKEQKHTVIDIGEKICSRCNLLLSSTLFTVNQKTCDNLSTFCIACARPNNWTIEKQRQSYIKYDQKNKEYRTQQRNIPHNKIRSNIAQRIRFALKSQKQYKSNNTQEYIGCEMSFFRKWFEYQFEDNMGWHNIGDWHIDHVKPCSSYNLSDKNQQFECFNWKNLRPVWAHINLSKSNKIDYTLIQMHKAKADNFEKLFLAQVKEGDLLEHPESP